MVISTSGKMKSVYKKVNVVTIHYLVSVMNHIYMVLEMYTAQ